MVQVWTQHELATETEAQCKGCISTNFHTSSKRIARVACIYRTIYFSLQMHAELELAHRLQLWKYAEINLTNNTTLT